MSDTRTFVDTHVHFWDHDVPGLRWRWLEPGFRHRKLTAMDSLDAPRYTPPEFRAETAGADVTAIVHVQAIDGVEDLAVETEWLQQLAERHAMPSALVGSCVVDDPGAVDLLARHARHRLCVGVRDITTAKHLDADAGAATFDELARRGWSFEARRHHDHDGFAVLDAIAARWPDLVLVLSHACLPLERTDSERRAWATAAARLAKRPNVVCKISAVAGASDPNWTVASIRPWILECIAVFGADRCMFGSNWPVDRQFGTYVGLIDAYREVVGELTDAEQEAVLSGTARRLYRIAP